MSATTTEGTGPGAVERSIPRIYNNQIRIQNIANINEITQIVELPLPDRIDGGVLQAMSALSEEDIKTILKAAEILKGMK